MEITKTYPELVALAHNVKLNESGWWQKSFQNLIMFEMWISDTLMSDEELRATLIHDFSVDMDQARFGEQIKALIDRGVILRMMDAKLKLSLKSKDEYERDVKEGEDIERAVISRFKTLITEYCPYLDPKKTWHEFESEMLMPLILEMGARTYALIDGGNELIPQTTSFGTFVELYPQESRQAVKNLVIRFLDPKDSNVRSYVLRNLNACFFAEAARLPVETLDRLEMVTHRKPSFKIFVDSNVIFSILGIHENPSNDAAKLMVDLAKCISNRADVKFYVLPSTAEETKNALSNYLSENDLIKWNMTPNLAKAGLKIGLAGFAQKLANESNKVGRPVFAEEYFGPYANNLLTILHDRDIHRYSADMGEYKTKQEVIDDIFAQDEYEKKHHAPEKCKSYEKMEHDVILWHFTRDQRPKDLESPLEAKYWVVTVDYRLLGFDAYKRRHSPNGMPVCLHPTTLIQMLGFWVPRTKEFEEAVIGSMRLPFLFQEFDPETEKVTVNILRALSRMDEHGDLSCDTAYKILVNESLRQKIGSSKEITEQIQYVKNALVEEDELRNAENRSAKEQAEKTRSIADKASIEKDLLLARATKAEKEAKRLKMENDVSLALASRAKEKVQQIENELEKKKNSAAKQNLKITLLNILLICALLGVVCTVTLTRVAHFSLLEAFICSFAILIYIFVYYIDRKFYKSEIFIESTFLQKLHKLRKSIKFAFIAIILSLIANEIYYRIHHR